jgi:hypothetical protein
MRRPRFLPLVCVIGITLMLSGRVWADDCAAFSDAAIAQAKVPHATMHVATAPGESEQRTETIVTADKVYTQIDGAWHGTPLSAQDVLEAIKEARERGRNTPRTCQKVPGETINGEPTTLLNVHSESNGQTADAKIWISNSSGLPLKSEMRFSSGSVIYDTFRYDNVTAPPGVN